MRDEKDQRLYALLKQHLSPVRGDLDDDLWPRMLERINEHSIQRVSWLDWALLGLVMLLLAVAPNVIPILLYQL